jgi:hypothetical protein
MHVELKRARGTPCKIYRHFAIINTEQFFLHFLPLYACLCACSLYAASVYCYYAIAGSVFDFRFERSLRFHAMRA